MLREPQMDRALVRVEPARPVSETIEVGSPRAARASRLASQYPLQPLEHLDALWVQVAGTLCNLRCAHCFVSCGPGEDRHALMARAEVRTRVAEALALGVREFYFTGGEPFLHPELIDIVEDTLVGGPCTVLTNGTLFTQRSIGALRRLSDASHHSLEIRVSLDGWTAETHDRFRGPGAFERTVEGLRRLDEHGLLPIVTATQTEDEDPLALAERYRAMLRSAGLRRPRLKLLPMFRLGRECERSGGYTSDESLAGASVEPGRLQCASVRAVSSQGVFVCPLLVDEAGGRMADTLVGALGPFEVRYGACFTCAVTGMTCGNG